MLKFTGMSIKSQLFLIIFIISFFAAGLIVYSGIKLRHEKIYETRKDTEVLADILVNEHGSMVADMQQLMLTLSRLPEVRGHNTAGMEEVLRETLRANPKYSNILITDPAGNSMASAVPGDATNISDRRYFIQARLSGKFSSGEYMVSRFTGRPVLAFCCPFKDSRGEIAGMIIMGVDPNHYRRVLGNLQLPPLSGYVLLDHKGIIMGRGTDSDGSIGRQYHPADFKKMQDGPEADTHIAFAQDGKKKFISYRKLRLEGEKVPYMYISAGIPVDATLAKANAALFYNITLFMSFLCLVVILAWHIGKRAITSPVALLEKASGRLADGELQTRASDIIKGGELGNLALRFDQMAERIASREQALRTNQARIDLAVRSAHMGVWHWDITSNTRYFDEYVCRLLGIEPAAFTGTEDEFFNSIHPEDRETIRTALARTIEQDVLYESEYRTIWPDGTVHYIASRGKLARDDKGGPLRINGIIWDITDRKRTEEKLREYSKYLEELVIRRTEEALKAAHLASIGELAAGVAHEINNPINSIINYAQVLDDRLPGESMEKDISGRITKEGNRIAAIVSSLLVFGREQKDEQRPVSIKEIIQESLNLTGAQLRKDGIHLKLDIDGPVPEITANPQQLQQVFVNLISNARYALNRRYPGQHEEKIMAITCEMTSRDGAPYIRIGFADYGTGISADIIDKVTGPFFTTKPSGQGTGLGLSISRGIVERHGGRLIIESEEGEYTLALVELPAREGA